MLRLSATAALIFATAAPAMSQTVFDLDEIIFTATAQPASLDRVGTSVEVIDGADLDDLGEIQLADILTRLPGLSIAGNGPPGSTSQLRIRGAGAEYISVYIDGILVTDPTSVEQSYDNFTGLGTGSIRRIEILRGSQSALYGGTAVGGVVNITTIAGEDTPLGLSQRIEVQGGSNATAALDYALTQATETTRLSFGLSTTRSDGFSAGDAANGNTEADGYDQTRLSFGVEHEVTAALTLGFNGFYETGSVEFDEFGLIPVLGVFGPVDGTPDEVTERDARGLRLSALYETGAWSHEAAVAGYSITRDSASNGTTSRFEGDRLTFDYVGSYEVSDATVLSFGVDARDETATYANQAGGTNSVQTYGAFVEAGFAPTELLDITATLRHDDHSTFGGQTTGRIALAYRATDALTLRAAVGSGYRPPSLDELYGSYPGSNFIGNPGLTPETSVSYEIGTDYEFANGAQLSATLFHLTIDNLITYQPGAPATLVNVSGTSERSGVEIGGAVPLGQRITLTGAYTYTDAYDASGVRLPDIARHDLVLGIDAALTDRITLSGTAQYVADRANGTFAVNPYDDYTVVDLAVGYAVTDDLEAFARIENLFDEDYQTISGYGTSGRAAYLGIRARF